MKNKKDNIIDLKNLSREERIKKLGAAKDTIKSEFVGLNDIIDEIFNSVEPWYVTPEIIKRPVIVSLWGMTGTGKSSVVKRLVELLDLDRMTLFVDCGKEADEHSSEDDIIDSTCGLLGIEREDSPSSIKEKDLSNMIFVFDEFQYARTLDDCGEELSSKSNLRCIWKIIDDGIMDITDNYSYEFKKFGNFINDISMVAKQHPEIVVKNNVVNNPDDVKIILNNIGYYTYPWRKVPSLEKFSDKDADCEYSFQSEEVEEINPDEEEVESNGKKIDKEDPYRPLKIIPLEFIRTIGRRSNQLGFNCSKELIDMIFSATSFGELYDILKKISKKLNTHNILDCSKSLVFIVGNLDEAFKVEDDINPDLDADVFKDITSHVTISDIKEALKKRFRAEQIARIGNNLVKYPTLSSSSFKEIIKREVKRIITGYTKDIDNKITIKVDPEIYNLIYREGVFPTQGVRPVFTTIGSMFTPYLSKILINKKEDDTKVTIGLKNKDDSKVFNFKLSNTIITLTFDNNRVVEYDYFLQLGSLRDPKKTKNRYINAVHESGHAIITSVVNGVPPQLIVAVSTDKGGFCCTYNNENDREINSRQDIDNEVMVCLGGYEAEKLIFGKDRPEMCLMGSSSDLRNAWDTFSIAVQKCGYFDPVLYTNYETEDNISISSGFDIKNSKVRYNSEEFTVEEAMRSRWKELKEQTYKYLQVETKLIKKLAVYLGEYGSMTEEKFLEFVDKYGNNLTRDHMKTIKSSVGSDFYLSKLED